jgi:hypothetical protein
MYSTFLSFKAVIEGYWRVSQVPIYIIGMNHSEYNTFHVIYVAKTWWCTFIYLKYANACNMYMSKVRYNKVAQWKQTMNYVWNCSKKFSNSFPFRVLIDWALYVLEIFRKRTKNELYLSWSLDLGISTYTLLLKPAGYFTGWSFRTISWVYLNQSIFYFMEHKKIEYNVYVHSHRYQFINYYLDTFFTHT